MEEFKDLHELVTEWESYTDKLAKLVKEESPTDEQKAEISELAASNFATALEIQDIIKGAIKEYKKIFKLKEADIRRWMSNEDV